MSSIGISAVVVVLAFGGVLFGMFLRSLLPQHHLSADLKDIAKVALGIIATISALVLSLLLSTAKASYDARGSELVQMSADILLLDRVLAYYGPDASDTRSQLRAAVTEAIGRFWPSDDAAAIGFSLNAPEVEMLHDRVSHLKAETGEHQALRLQGLQLVAEISRSGFLLASHGPHSIPLPFLIVVISWLAVIFTGLGLFAPVNPTAIVIFLICALSAAGAIFLILELDDPFVGIIRLSDTPLQLVLAHLGQ
jgi:hypothetical protein